MKEFIVTKAENSCENGIAFRKMDNTWIYFLEFPHQLKENGYGITNHPSIKTHKINGKYLAEKIREIV